MKGSHSPIVYAAAAIAGIGGLLFGYDTGVISGAILFITPAFHLSTTLEEVVVSTVLGGAVVGAIFGGGLGDHWGRRKTITYAGATFVLGSIVCAIAPNVWILIAGRFIIGLSIGVASFSVPLYISELAPSSARGWLVSVNQLAVTLGIVLSYGTDYLFSPMHAWRWMFAVAVIPATVLVTGMYFLPESPRWLVQHGLGERAHSVLRRLRGHADVAAEINEIKQSLEAQAGGWRQLLTPNVRPTLIIGVSLAILQQVTGINTVIYYAPTIFEMAGQKSASVAILATAGVGTLNVAFTIVAMTLIDRLGRRPLLLTGLTGMALSLALLGLTFYAPDIFGAGNQGWAAAFCLGLYVATFAIGLGPVFWLLISEIYPLKVRSRAMSIATVANWGANLVVALTFLTLIGTVGRPVTFWLYAAIAACAALFSWRLVPETKGKTLEQIERHWQAGKHPRAL